MIQQFDSLMQLMETFADEQTAIDHLTAIRWRGGAFCPHCNGRRIYHFSDRRTHKCGDCRKRFSIKVGTIFQDTKIQLRKWFAAIWLITSHKKGIASAQLARDIKVTQKTGWFMLHRLREAARTNSFNRPLIGDIEADETRIGGKERNKHAHKGLGREATSGGKGKAILFGMLKRAGELRVKRCRTSSASPCCARLGTTSAGAAPSTQMSTTATGDWKGAATNTRPLTIQPASMRIAMAVAFKELKGSGPC